MARSTKKPVRKSANKTARRGAKKPTRPKGPVTKPSHSDEGVAFVLDGQDIGKHDIKTVPRVGDTVVCSNPALASDPAAAPTVRARVDAVEFSIVGDGGDDNGDGAGTTVRLAST